MSSRVTVLNSDFAAINHISVRRAKHMIENGKAIPVEYEGDLKNRREASFIPKKILLIKLVSELYGMKAKWTKEHMVERDENRCVYCGIRLSSKSLEIEHVIPASRGGQINWLNTVSACRACNQKKANRTPEEAGMSYYKPGYRPYQPMLYEFIVKRHKKPELDTWFKEFDGIPPEVVEEFNYRMNK